jgi:hypothetical protein
MSGSYDQGLVPLYTAQYSTNVDLLLQQKGSKLRPTVTEGFHVGKMASPVNQVGPVVAKSPAGRFAPLNNTQTTYVRRWVFPTSADINQLVDRFDELQTIVDPKSALVTGAGYAMGRFWDDQILAATTATAQIGVDAGALTSETFSTTNFQIAVNFQSGANVGLTVAKLIELRRILQHYHNDLDSESITMVIGSKQEADLLAQQQVISKEYGGMGMDSGRIKSFLGINFEVMERVPETTAGSVRGAIAWVKSGMYLGVWRDLENNISQRKDLSSLPWQVYTEAVCGATRTQPGKVVQLLCADTTGADINP